MLDAQEKRRMRTESGGGRGSGRDIDLKRVIGNSAMNSVCREEEGSGGGVMQRVRILNSQTLGRNITKETKKNARKGEEAHHIIPNELVVESVNENIKSIEGMGSLSDIQKTFDEAWNGIFLPTQSSKPSDKKLVQHTGREEKIKDHPAYTDTVRAYIAQEEGNIKKLVLDKEYAQSVAEYFREKIEGMQKKEEKYLDDIGGYLKEGKEEWYLKSKKKEEQGGSRHGYGTRWAEKRKLDETEDKKREDTLEEKRRRTK